MTYFILPAKGWYILQQVMEWPMSHTSDKFLDAKCAIPNLLSTKRLLKFLEISKEPVKLHKELQNCSKHVNREDRDKYLI